MSGDRPFVTIDTIDGNSDPSTIKGVPDICFAYTCGAVQAGSMVVLCDCGCVRQHDRPHDFAADVQLKGWFCWCGIFNGEEKERLNICRTCGVARPM